MTNFFNAVRDANTKLANAADMAFVPEPPTDICWSLPLTKRRIEAMVSRIDSGQAIFNKDDPRTDADRSAKIKSRLGWPLLF